MSTPDMTDEDANKLFAQVSQAMLADDSEKLSTLLAQETPAVEQPVVDTPLADEPEEIEEVEDTSDDTVEVDDDTPPADDTAGNDKEDDSDPVVQLRAEIEKLRSELQPLKSQTGRVSALQRRLSQYDRQLAELSQSTSSQTVEKVTPKIDETLKELEITDPALAKTIRQVMEQALSGVASESNAQQIASIEAAREADYEEYKEEQTRELLTKYPNAGQVFTSPHWAEWKKTQPKHILDLATSDSAEAVGMALERYREDMILKYPELNKNKEPEKKVDEVPVVNERAQQIEGERKRQQQQAANLDSGKPPARSKEPADPEALFKKAFAEVHKEITGK